MVFNVLVIDDSENDRFFFQRALDGSGVTANVTFLPDAADVLPSITSQEYDCIFLDYHLPGMNGLEILQQIRKTGLDTPVIMLTGQKDEMTAVQLMHEGANDYLSKRLLNPESLRLSLENTRKLYILKKEKLLAEEALRNSEAKLSEAQQIAKLGNWEFNFNSGLFFFSNEAYPILDYSKDSDIPTFRNLYRKIHPEDIGILKEATNKVKKRENYDITFRIITSDGAYKSLNTIGNIVPGPNGSIEKIVGTIQDVTILKKALYETKKATARGKATSILFSVTIVLFLISEALLDPFIDSLAMGIAIALSFKGGIALLLKSLEGFMGRFMLRLSFIKSSN